MGSTCDGIIVLFHGCIMHCAACFGPTPAAPRRYISSIYFLITMIYTMPCGNISRNRLCIARNPILLQYSLVGFSQSCSVGVETPWRCCARILTFCILDDALSATGTAEEQHNSILWAQSKNHWFVLHPKPVSPRPHLLQHGPCTWLRCQ